MSASKSGGIPTAPTLARKLLSILAAPDSRPMTKSELAREMRLPTEGRRTLREAIDSLEKKGKIIQVNSKRYALRNREAPKAEKSGKNPKNPKQEKGAKRQERSGREKRRKPEKAQKASAQQVVTGKMTFRFDGHGYLYIDLSDPDNAPALAMLERETGSPQDRLFVHNRQTKNALPDDIVSARLTEGGPPEKRFRSKGGKEDKRKGRGSREKRQEEKEEVTFDARILKVLTRSGKRFTGTFRVEGKHFSVKTDGAGFPSPIRIPKEFTKGAKDGDLVVGTIEDWPGADVPATGHIAKNLGDPTAAGVDIMAVIYKHGLPLEFPKKVLDEAKAIGTTVSEEDATEPGREDWRDRFVMTIDPYDARDFDDAIAVTPLPDREGGGWELAVHIADVSHYVRPGTKLDKEAQIRGNSTYLVDRVIPMLPETLSNGICSLVPDEDRLTRCVVIRFGKDGSTKSVRFTAAVIRSKCRLSYEQAYKILKEPTPGDIVSDLVADAWELASILRKRRFAKGSLDLDFPEVKVHVDRKTGVPLRMERIEYDESHQLIEEFMLAANEHVARAVKQAEKPCIYRIHEDPDPGRLEEYAEMLRAHGIPCGNLSEAPGELQRALKETRGMSEEYALKVGLLKSLKRAVYSTSPLGHFGLSKEDYTHYTSPIRRYADLVVHRVLDAVVTRNHVKLPSQAKMEEICKHISTSERTSADAETETKRLKEMEYLMIQANKENAPPMKAIVHEARPMGLFIELTDYLIKGLVHKKDIPMDRELFFDTTRKQFAADSGNRAYGPGTLIEVRPVRVDFERMRADFEVIGTEATAPAKSLGKGKSKRPAKKKSGKKKGAARKKVARRKRR